MNEQIVILDFGSQYTQVIARRIRECNVYSTILRFDTPASEIAALKPKGIILSGGPSSVYADEAPLPDKAIFKLGVPVLGVCYGLQLMAHFLGGKVEPGQKGVISRIAPFLILPLVAILVWRIFFRKKRVSTAHAAKQKFEWPGLDSEYYELEARLAASGHERHPHETPAQWLARLRRDGIDHPSLPALIDLHYRYRFDPSGLNASARTQLKALARTQVQIASDDELHGYR